MKFKPLFFSIAAAGLLCSRGTAADASAYGVLKGEAYVQTASAPPALAVTQPSRFVAFVTVDPFGEVDGATVSTPGGATLVLQDDFNAFDEQRLSITNYYASTAALNSSAPAGPYTFAIDAVNDQFTVASLGLPATAFPAFPVFVNIPATIDANQGFTLTWGAFPGASADDRIYVEIDDARGFTAYASPSFTQAGAISGGATTFQIPAGTLDENATYTATVRFIKIANKDITTYPGATGMAGFYRETSFVFRTGATTGGGDTTPPALTFSFPSNGATDVNAQSLITFSFNEPMAASQSIQWSSNVDANKFSYFWSGDKKTLTGLYSGGFASGAAVTWRLNPIPGLAGNFRDAAGNELPSGVFSGQFTIAGGTTGGGDTNEFCRSGITNDPNRGSFSLFKGVNYVQTNNAAPVLDPQAGATLGATMSAPSGQTYRSASLRLPNGTTRSLTNFFGSDFFLFDNFNSQAALDAAYPPGAYVLQAQTSNGGSASANLDLSGAYPPIPQVLNLSELQSMNPSSEFTLRWNAFAGAGQADVIALEIRDPQGAVFFAPDYCLPRPLPNTATSIVIPAGTFKTSGQYEGTLHFSRLLGIDTNSIPGSGGSAGIFATTKFTFQVGATNSATVKWTDIHKKADGSVEMTLSGPANGTFVIETSSDLKVWTQVFNQKSANGAVVYTDAQAPAVKARFFRGKVQ